MGLFEKAKRVLKRSNTNVLSSSSGSAPGPDAATSKNLSQSTETEIRPWKVPRPLGVNVWSPGLSTVVEYADIMKIRT